MNRRELLGLKQQSSVIPVTHDIFNVVKEGNLQVLDQMMKEPDFNVNLTRWSGFSLLHRAATEGQTDVCDMLIKAGARVNQKSVWGWYTPLHLALANGYEDTAKYLIEQGANVRAKSKWKEDCCDYAQRRGFKELAAQFRLRLARYEMQQLADARKQRAEKSRALMEQIDAAREAQETLAAAAAAAQVWERPNTSTSQFGTRSSALEGLDEEVADELKELDLTLKEIEVCVLCHTRPRAHILVPCRHFILCGPCCDAPSVKTEGCPTCKTDVKAHYKKT